MMGFEHLPRRALRVRWVPLLACGAVACSPPDSNALARADVTLDAALGDDATSSTRSVPAPGVVRPGGALLPAVSDGGLTDGPIVDGTTTDSGAPDAESGVSRCFHVGPTTLPAQAICGDGYREPSEECNFGNAALSPPQTLCTSGCQTLDMLAAAQIGPDGGLSNVPRTLGGGRHPVAATTNIWAVAYLEPDDAAPLSLYLSEFEPQTSQLQRFPFSTGSAIVDQSNPVLAGVDCDQGFVAAWADFGNDGDELGVAIRFVSLNAPSNPTPPLQFANTTVTGSQFDPDIIITQSGVVVAWVDSSNVATAPDVRFRSFDTSLNPQSPEQTLAATTDSEADVALAAFDGSWIASWRDDAEGLETVKVQTASGIAWTIGPAFLPAPVSSRPAITALDSTHALVAYAVGTDPTESGVANGSALMVVVLDVALPGPVSGTPLAGTLSTQSQDSPAAATVGSTAYVAWHSAAAPGDPNGEDNYLKAMAFDGTTLDETQAEIPLPRWPQARLGDQRAPALAAVDLPPTGALWAGWDDLGRSLFPGEGAGDTAVELIPVPVVRETSEQCAQGTADCSGNPELGCPTNTTTAQNCGGCGHACSTNAPICQSGQCIANCPTGQAFCYGSCIDITSNADECGGCGITCGSAGCVNGACCPPGYAGCPSEAPSECVNEWADPANCGTCGHVCPSVTNGQPACNSAACGATCGAGLTFCASESACDNLQSGDLNNCGTCGHVCPAVANGSSTCSSATCGFTCHSGFSACPTASPTECTNEQTDVNNCGACGKVCSPASNGGVATCSTGACGVSCPGNDVYCSSTNLCVNTAGDVNNCGGCGNVCSAPPNSSPVCLSGSCHWQCDTNYLICNNSCIPAADTVHGAFVSAANGVTTSGCGSQMEPCLTISSALSNNPSKTLFYVAGGTYTEQVTLPAGITIEGGWTDSGGSWSDCSANATTIKAPTGSTSVVVANYSGSSTLANLSINNSNTASAGESLYGVLATGTTTSLTLTNVTVTVAAGGAGIAGSTGATAASPASSCTASTGANGTAGTAGSAGAASYTSSGYQPGTGGAGTSGTSGANGTAGGGTSEEVGTCTVVSGHCTNGERLVTGHSGAPGCASGGAGGGTGGVGGGASIGIFAWGATVAFATGSITTGAGGTGGAGGPAGATVAGTAGTAGTTVVASACGCGGSTCACGNTNIPGGAAGGTGGTGGAGGKGAGGSGGDSHCYVQGGGATVTWSGTCSTGAAGAGGSPGGVAGNAGLHN